MTSRSGEIALANAGQASDDIAQLGRLIEILVEAINRIDHPEPANYLHSQPEYIAWEAKRRQLRAMGIKV